LVASGRNRVHACLRRGFGDTRISRFRDGWLLLKMLWFALSQIEGDLNFHRAIRFHASMPCDCFTVRAVDRRCCRISVVDAARGTD